MNTVAGVIAGFAVIGGAVALYRFGRQRGEALRRTLKAWRDGEQDGSVIDFERDPQSGVYRAKI